jgi:tetratricopeptide (TPR) repeat protein
VLLVGCITWLFGLSPTPKALQQAGQDYARAVEAGSARQAAESLERAAQFQPWRVDLPVAAARYRLQAGDLEHLSASLERPELRAALTSADWLHLGDLYLANGELQQAEAAWQQGLQADSSALELYDRLVSLYLEQGNYAAAVQALRPTVALQPDDPLRAYRLGLYLSAVQPVEALVYLELAKQEASLAEPAGRLQRVIRSAELEAEPAYTYLQAGTQLARLGEWALSGEAFRQAVFLRPDYAEAWALLAEARQQVSDSPQQARADLDQALKLKPDSALVNSLFALYWERQGEIEKSIACLAAAADAEPENPAWQAEWGRLLALQGDLQAAQERYQQAVSLAPEEGLYWRLLAEFSMRHAVDVAGLALPAARQALELQPGEAAALDLLGQVYLSLGNDLLAERYLQQAVQEQPGYAPAWMHLGAVYLVRGQADLASAMLQHASQLAEPGSAVADQVQRLMEHASP